LHELSSQDSNGKRNRKRKNNDEPELCALTVNGVKLRNETETSRKYIIIIYDDDDLNQQSIDDK